MALDFLNFFTGGSLKDTKADSIVQESESLTLDLDDDKLVEVLDKRIETSRSWFEKEQNLSKRREKNYRYLLGNQDGLKGLAPYNSPYLDNIIYEALTTIEPLAMSRLPDLLAKPGNESEASKDNAQRITDILNSDLRQRENKEVFSKAFVHLPVHFTGIIKAYWNREKQDYGFKAVHPKNIVIDHTAATNKSEGMDFIAEEVEISVKELTMMFPKKKEEILKEFQQKTVGRLGKLTDDKLASKVKIWEVWFTWYDSAKDPETGEAKWERVEAVVWKYNKLLLGKVRHPYWDWEGENRLFSLIPEGKEEADEDEIRQAIFGMEELPTEQVFHNFFPTPQKPYFFMGQHQWDDMPLDATSWLEQILLQQDNINKRGRQITEMNDRAKGKHVFNASALKKDDVENLDMNDPDQDVIVDPKDGNVNNAHTYIQGQPAPAQLYTEQETERQKAFAKAKAHSTTRGEKQTDVATTNQLLRESDFTAIDYAVDRTINAAAEWMSRWSLQFIKMFYTAPHMRKLVGKDGESTLLAITRDNVEDGMEVIVTASGVDKLQRKREAFEMAKMQMIDPLSFFQDMDVSDPLGRTRKLMLFMMTPQLYFQEHIEKRGPQEQVQALQQSVQPPAQPPESGEPGVPTTEQAAQMFGGQGGGWPPLGYGGGARDFFPQSPAR